MHAALATALSCLIAALAWAPAAGAAPPPRLFHVACDDGSGFTLRYPADGLAEIRFPNQPDPITLHQVLSGSGTDYRGGAWRLREHQGRITLTDERKAADRLCRLAAG